MPAEQRPHLLGKRLRRRRPKLVSRTSAEKELEHGSAKHLLAIDDEAPNALARKLTNLGETVMYPRNRVFEHRARSLVTQRIFEDQPIATTHGVPFLRDAPATRRHMLSRYEVESGAGGILPPVVL